MIKHIEDKISRIDKHFRAESNTSETERLFSRVIKLNEEVGELCEAVLCENDKNQRDKEKSTDLDSELADVIICLLLLAHNRPKSIWEEVDKKLDKQIKRFNI